MRFHLDIVSAQNHLRFDSDLHPGISGLGPKGPSISEKGGQHLSQLGPNPLYSNNSLCKIRTIQQDRTKCVSNIYFSFILQFNLTDLILLSNSGDLVK